MSFPGKPDAFGCESLWIEMLGFDFKSSNIVLMDFVTKWAAINQFVVYIMHSKVRMLKIIFREDLFVCAMSLRASSISLLEVVSTFVSISFKTSPAFLVSS